MRRSLKAYSCVVGKKTPRGQLRAADTDREHVAEQLRSAHAEGRLDLSEYDERIQQAWAARTYGELKALTADLPQAHTAVTRAQRRINGYAVASLVLGTVWMFWIGSILALVFGYAARRQITKRGEGGASLATAGIVLGWVGIGILAILLIPVLFAIWLSGPTPVP
jgi:Domain of unknown function (DUF1707)/Domain of unknown function (DUF4190)